MVVAIDGRNAMNDNEKEQGQVPSETPQGLESEGGEDSRAEPVSDSPQDDPDEQASAEGSSVVKEESGPEQVDAEVQEPREDPLEKALDENKKLREQMLRVAADFDNFRKRARRESEEACRRARIELLRELLPVFDNMERAVAHAEQATDAKAVATGVQMVIKQFQDTAGKLGVARVDAVGSPFDPNVHEAIQQIETDDHPPGTVVAELLPGYVFGDRLLRAAMVVVAKARAVEAASVEQTQVGEGVEGEAALDSSTVDGAVGEDGSGAAAKREEGQS